MNALVVHQRYSFMAADGYSDKIKARNNGCNVSDDTLATSLVTFVATQQNLEFQLIIRENLMLEGVCHAHRTYLHCITIHVICGSCNPASRQCHHSGTYIR